MNEIFFIFSTLLFIEILLPLGFYGNNKNNDTIHHNNVIT